MTRRPKGLSELGSMRLSYPMAAGSAQALGLHRRPRAESGGRLGQALLIAEISNSRVIFSLTSTPPVSSAAFQVIP